MTKLQGTEFATFLPNSCMDFFMNFKSRHGNEALLTQLAFLLLVVVVFVPPVRFHLTILGKT